MYTNVSMYSVTLIHQLTEHSFFAAGASLQVDSSTATVEVPGSSSDLFWPLPGIQDFQITQLLRITLKIADLQRDTQVSLSCLSCFHLFR